jgi:DNA-binding transcriptional regulator YhcF (GntR family)
MHAGDQLPTLKEVVEALAIPNAVIKAYGELEHEGLVVRRQGGDLHRFDAACPASGR